MCYSVTSSAVAYTIGLLSSCAALYLNHPVVATLIATYSGVQVAEGVIWYSLDEEMPTVNRYGTNLLVWNLSSHALLTVSAAIYFGVISRSRYTRYEKLVLFVLWAVALTLMLGTVAGKRVGAKTDSMCRTPPTVAPPTVPWDVQCRLWWNWSPLNGWVAGALYAAQCAVIFATLYIVYRHSTTTAWGIIVFYMLMLVAMVGVSAYSVRDQTPGAPGATPSTERALLTGASTMWCFGSAVAAPLLVAWLWWTHGHEG